MIDEEILLLPTEMRNAAQAEQFQSLHIMQFEKNGIARLRDLLDRYRGEIKRNRIPLVAIFSLLDIIWYHWDELERQTLKLVYNSKDKKFIAYEPSKWAAIQAEVAEFEKFFAPLKRKIKDENINDSRRGDKLVAEAWKRNFEIWKAGRKNK